MGGILGVFANRAYAGSHGVVLIESDGSSFEDRLTPNRRVRQAELIIRRDPTAQVFSSVRDPVKIILSPISSTALCHCSVYLSKTKTKLFLAQETIFDTTAGREERISLMRMSVILS